MAHKFYMPVKDQGKDSAFPFLFILIVAYNRI